MEIMKMNFADSPIGAHCERKYNIVAAEMADASRYTFDKNKFLEGNLEGRWAIYLPELSKETLSPRFYVFYLYSFKECPEDAIVVKNGQAVLGSIETYLDATDWRLGSRVNGGKRLYDYLNDNYPPPFRTDFM